MTPLKFLVTGATSGVGKEVARELLANGHNVVAIGRNVDRLRQLYETPQAVALLLDFEGVEPNEITERIRDLGPFDGIFHAAGAELVQPLRLTSDEQFFRAMTLAASAFGILRAASLRQVMTDGGSVVLMSSVAATRGVPGMAAYAAARASIEAMTRVAAAEFAARHVRVNCVAAGAFESPMHVRILQRLPEASQIAYRAKHPLGFGMTREIRDAVIFLLSDRSRWSTGTVMVVDGGFLAT